MIKRTITCDVCGAEAVEAHTNEGWEGWGSLQGIALNGAANPSLCPACITLVAEFVDNMEVRSGLD